MICKEDVVLWFKELESYRRIDTMCTLLNMCLPFELRFLGTCLEELGRRDSQELRGIELRVNNPSELASDIASCQSGEPTDMKIRRKMALYLALIRTCSRSCVDELFKTLDEWGERDFHKFNDGDPLQELLLIYTMATNHPVFSFEQRMKCGEIFTKIKECKLGSYNQQTSPCQESIPLQGNHQQLSTPIQIMQQGNIPMGFPQMIQADPNISHHLAVDGVHQMIPSNLPIRPEYTVTHPGVMTWALRPNLQVYPSTTMEQHPSSSTSPILSQPSSPTQSRTTSPTRSNTTIMQQQHQHQIPQQQQQQQSQQILRNSQQRNMRNNRRPSIETIPTPVQQSQHQHVIGLVGNSELIIPPNFKNFEEVLLNVDGMTQLQTICRNGYTRPIHHTLPRPSKSSVPLHHNQHHNQHTQNILGQPIQQPGNFGVNTTLSYTLQNMNLVDVHASMENNIVTNRNKSGGSDSGSSIGSTGDLSPPDTPTLVSTSNNTVRINDQNTFNKQMNITRLNGRQEKLLSGIGITTTGGSSTATIIYAAANSSQQQQQQFLGNEIILTAGPNIMQSSLTNNNNNNNKNNNLSSTGNINSSNNTLVTSTVLISSPSNVTSGVSNVIASSPVILQQQQQFNATFPYHGQHLATVNRPPIITHNPTIAPTSSNYVRHHGYQIQPNGDILYPYPTQVGSAGITFLQASGGPSPQNVRSPQSSTITTPVSLQQQQQQNSQNSNSLLAAAPYTNLTIGSNKNISCFNCGSQSHIGRDCQEASMEDVTRNSVYKLDYSSIGLASSPNNHGSLNSGNNIVSVSSNNSSNSSNCNSNNNINNNNINSNNYSSGGVSSVANIGINSNSNISATEKNTEIFSSTSSSSSLSNTNK